LIFAFDTVTYSCGSLIPQYAPYSVERNGSQLVVRLAIPGKTLPLSLKTDGKLVGPGPIDIAGMVVAGGAQDHTSTSYSMQGHTTTTQQQIDANDIPNYNATDVHQNGMEYSVNKQSTTYEMTPTTTHHYSVPTKPKVEHCNVAILAPSAQTPSTSALLTSILGSKQSKSSNTAPGLRLNGTYAAAGGLKIEFREDSATLECGEARNSEGYAVVPENGQLLVKFQNNTGPLSLVLQPNGSLSGPTAIDVAGRRAYEGSDGHLAFAPLTSHCAVGA